MEGKLKKIKAASYIMFSIAFISTTYSCINYFVLNRVGPFLNTSHNITFTSLFLFLGLNSYHDIKIRKINKMKKEEAEKSSTDEIKKN